MIEASLTCMHYKRHATRDRGPDHELLRFRLILKKLRFARR